MTENDIAALYIWAMSLDMDAETVDRILDRISPGWRYRLGLEQAKRLLRDWHNFAPYRLRE